MNGEGHLADDHEGADDATDDGDQRPGDQRMLREGKGEVAA